MVALLAAAFASGNIRAILGFLEQFLERMGPHPARWLAEHQPSSLDGTFAGLGHRWVRSEDLAVLAALLGSALRRHGTLGALWRHGDDPADATTWGALGRFTAALREQPIAPLTARVREVQRADGRTTALAPIHSILLTPPERGSACKRMHLFLRWVARPRDGVDLGLWTDFLRPARLQMPIDVHVLRQAQALRLTKRRLPDARACEEITTALRRLNPEDPCRYDFALVRVGIEQFRSG